MMMSCTIHAVDMLLHSKGNVLPPERENTY